MYHLLRYRSKCITVNENTGKDSAEIAKLLHINYYKSGSQIVLSVGRKTQNYPGRIGRRKPVHCHDEYRLQEMLTKRQACEYNRRTSPQVTLFCEYREFSSDTMITMSHTHTHTHTHTRTHAFPIGVQVPLLPLIKTGSLQSGLFSLSFCTGLAATQW